MSSKIDEAEYQQHLGAFLKILETQPNMFQQLGTTSTTGERLAEVAFSFITRLSDWKAQQVQPRNQ